MTENSNGVLEITFPVVMIFIYPSIMYLYYTNKCPGGLISLKTGYCTYIWEISLNVLKVRNLIFNSRVNQFQSLNRCRLLAMLINLVLTSCELISIAKQVNSALLV